MNRKYQDNMRRLLEDRNIIRQKIAALKADLFVLELEIKHQVIQHDNSYEFLRVDFNRLDKSL